MMIRQALTPWPHYPRQRLARHVLANLGGPGGRRTAVLTGPSGIGKTEFLCLDLMPLATADGFHCVYVDLGKRPARLVDSLLAQLDPDPSTQATVLASRPASCVARWLAPSLLGRLEWAPAATPDAAEPGITPRDIEPRLGQSMQRLLERDARPLLLILDNIESLHVPAHRPIAAALQRLLEQHGARVSAVCAGSSRTAFDAAAPHDSGSYAMPRETDVLFPRPDDGFEASICRWAASRTGGIEPDLDEMRDAMRALARSPRLFRSAFAQVLAGEAAHIGDAATQVRANAVNGIGLLAPISKLTPLQAVLLREIWHSGEALYASLHRARYAAATGVAEVSKVDVQGGLKRLERHGLVFRDGDGLYRLASTNLDLLFELDQLEQNAHAHAQPRREPRAAVVEPSAQALRIS